MIYFIRAMQSGAIKIGTSNDPKRRLETMQTGSPESLEIITVIPGQADEEKRLHQKFAKFRIHGEWFKGDPELIQGIRLLVQAPIDEVIEHNPAAYWIIRGEVANESNVRSVALFCVCRDEPLVPDPDKMMAAVSPHHYQFCEVESILNVSHLPEHWPKDLEALREPLTNRMCLAWVAYLEKLDRFFPAESPEVETETSHPTDVFRMGSVVVHPRYGVGEVLALDGDGLDRKGRVDFPKASEKTFILRKSELRLATPADLAADQAEKPKPKLIRMPATLPEWARPSNS